MDDKIAVVFDDHKTFTDSFSSWLERTGLFFFVYSFNRRRDLLSFFFETHEKPVFLFADYYTEGSNSLSTLYDIKRINPSVRFIVVSSIVHPPLIRKILELKPKGFLSKTADVGEVLHCIRTIEQNGVYVSPFITSLLDRLNADEFVVPFSPKELEVLGLLLKGHSVVHIAELLSLSKHTVIAHKRNMMRKTKCSSVVELLDYARQHNIG